MRTRCLQGAKTFPIIDEDLGIALTQEFVNGSPMVLLAAQSDDLDEPFTLRIACGLELATGDGGRFLTRGQLVISGHRYLALLSRDVGGSSMPLNDTHGDVLVATMVRTEAAWSVSQKNWRGKPTALAFRSLGYDGKVATLTAFSVVAFLKSDGRVVPVDLGGLIYSLSEEQRQNLLA